MFSDICFFSFLGFLGFFRFLVDDDTADVGVVDGSRDRAGGTGRAGAERCEEVRRHGRDILARALAEVYLDVVRGAVAIPRDWELAEDVQRAHCYDYGSSGYGSSGYGSIFRPVLHRNDAYLVTRTCGLNTVLVRMRAQCVHQAKAGISLVVLVFIPGQRSFLSPLLQVLLVPDDGVAIRAVVVVERDQRHGKVLPDVLAEFQVRHGPALKNLLLGRAHGLHLQRSHELAVNHALNDSRKDFGAPVVSVRLLGNALCHQVAVALLRVHGSELVQEDISTLRNGVVQHVAPYALRGLLDVLVQHSGGNCNGRHL